jgi:hypothetical protein
MDYTVPPLIPIEVVFVYQKPVSSSNEVLIPLYRVKHAVSCLLDYYPHLTGRLQGNAESRAHEIGQLGAGIELLGAHSTARLDDIASSTPSGRILMPNLPSSGNDLLPPFDRTYDGASQNPIFAIQHTRFACGGVALGIRVSHVVCDGTGFFQLARDLATIYRHLRTSTTPTLTPKVTIFPYLRGSLPFEPEELQEALSFKSSTFHVEEYSTDTANVEEAGRIPMVEDVPPVTGHVLRFSGRDLAALKQNATDPNGNFCVSTFEALAAYLYRRIYQARVELQESQAFPPASGWPKPPTGFWATMDVRGPNRLNLPERYFPNAVYCLDTNVPYDILLQGPLWQTAKAIHDLIHSVDMNYVNQEMRWIAAQPDKTRIKSYEFIDGSFAISQWSNLNMYKDVDFDAYEDRTPITPAMVSPPFTETNLIDGLALVLSTEEQLHRPLESGSSSSSSEEPCALEVNLTLIQPLWRILNHDSQFQGYFT